MSRRIRLCTADLHRQDIVEMIERETRPFQIHLIEDPDDPLFEPAYALLWGAFGEQGEMEDAATIRSLLRRDPFQPLGTGTWMRYFLLVALDNAGNIRGVRDGSILLNPGYDPDLCVVYLAHIYMRPEARGTVLSYWLRIAPVELAVQYLADLRARGEIDLPQPDHPGRYFGMHITLAAEMEHYTPEELISFQRLLFYGRGGFSAMNPYQFPYCQPDFDPASREREEGPQPIPFLLLLRRMGKEWEGKLPIQDAKAIINLLYDDFSCYPAAGPLDETRQRVLQRLEARGKTFVDLLPLPTGPENIGRLKRLFRYSVFKRYYADNPRAKRYLQGPMKQILAENPRYLEEAVQKLAIHLASRPKYVYGDREREFLWEGGDGLARAAGE